jgi:hypothetical protein
MEHTNFARRDGRIYLVYCAFQPKFPRAKNRLRLSKIMLLNFMMHGSFLDATLIKLTNFNSSFQRREERATKIPPNIYSHGKLL